MIKRLKRKYIIIVMLSFISVIGIMITAINLVSYSAVNAQLDEKLDMIIDNEGKMPDFPPPDFSTDDGDAPDGDEPENDGADADEGGEDIIEPDENPSGEPDGEETPEGDTEDGSESVDSTENEINDDSEEEDEEDEEDDPRQNMSPETPFETRFFSVKLNTDGTFASVDTSKIAAVDDELAMQYAMRILEHGKTSGYMGTYRFMRRDSEDGTICVFVDANRELESVRSFIVSSIIISIVGTVLVFVIVILLSETALKPIIESYEKQKRFITDAGHEMKTPLTVISANAEIIEMESGESQWIAGIHSQVAKLASLTEKLVLLSKMEEGAKLEMNEFSLSEALFDTCNQYKSISMSEGVSFNVLVSENVLVIGNEGELRRCVSLLLDNAFRYVNDGGTVEIRLEKLTSGVEIKISNTTDGVARGSLDRWFDRFYRTDLSRNSATGGSGIGLSVVKAIVNAHGGTVKASSSDGIKVEFTINI